MPFEYTASAALLSARISTYGSLEATAGAMVVVLPWAKTGPLNAAISATMMRPDLFMGCLSGLDGKSTHEIEPATEF